MLDGLSPYISSRYRHCCDTSKIYTGGQEKERVYSSKGLANGFVVGASGRLEGV